MLEFIYLCGFCFILYRVIVRYDSVIQTQAIAGSVYGIRFWVTDLVGAIVVSLWPLLLPIFILTFYRGLKAGIKGHRRKR